VSATAAATEDAALARFHPRIAAWFAERHGTPTDIQAAAWPRILDGEHVLATAPTGSGKTLCAFLAPLDHLFSGRWETGAVRVLYVSPLKALNNDIRRNLIEPLDALSGRWRAAGETPPRIRVATRSGDTDATERRRMLRDPPELLVTTPESLNILVSSGGGRALLGGVRMVILDEIHAVAADRRGLWLASGVEALAELAGEVQRVALSATVRPLERIAGLVGGHRRGVDGAPEARTRPVAVLRSAIRRDLDLRVEALAPDERPDDGGLDALGPIARSVRAATERNASTLVFANARALAEKLALRVNEGAGTGAPIAWAHHGSLSRELRLDVEARLKAGDLKAIVATSSLEMGIDIGALDEVVMVGAPPSVASAIQRAGRAGHRVGAVSHAVIHPTHPRDALEAAVLARAALDGDIEETPVPGPCLDVLAQVIVTRLAIAERTRDALFDAVRCAAPYRTLPREHFDLVVDMLLGLHHGRRLRELTPRLREDADSNRLQLLRGTLLALYTAGGMIPDRGYYQLRHAASGARIGELDEEFVWENGPGRAFSLGSQQWRVQRVTHDDVHVTPAPEARHAPPFWRSEDRDREPHFAARLRRFLADADAALDARDAGDPAPLDALVGTLPADRGTTAGIVDLLDRQRRHTDTGLPCAGRIVVEQVRTGPGGTTPGAGQLVLHTLAGGRVNRPWALALETAWRRHFGHAPEVFADDDAIVVQLAEDLEPADVLGLVRATDLDDLLRERLEDSGLFGARFRECAARALLIRRGRFGARLPLWMSRLQSQRLLGRLQQHGDFPMILEAWRACLVEAFDLPALRGLLDDLHAGRLAVARARTQRPSPFAADLAWRQVNTYMYMDDAHGGGGGGRTSSTLIERIVASDALRPAVDAETVATVLDRRCRRLPGWGPRTVPELEDWLAERRLIPEGDFLALCARTGADPGDAARFRRLDAPAGAQVCSARGAAPFGEDGDAATRLEWLGDWLGFRGPSTLDELDADWPGPRDDLVAGLDALAGSGALVRGPLLEGDDAERWCDAEVFEALLRARRAAARPALEPLPVTAIPGFLARWQQVDAADDLLDALEALRALPLPAALWAPAVLAARTGREPGAELDALLGRGDLICTGGGRDALQFAAADELDALPRPRGEDDPRIERAFADPSALYEFGALRAACDDDAGAATAALAAGVFGGRVALADFAAVRAGLAPDFRLPELAAEGGTTRRGSLRARVAARVRGVPGRFRRLPAPQPPGDSVARTERARERARLLVDRWGVVCPPLLAREAPGLRWRDVFGALRLMELAGEVVAGHFLEGLDGPQFAAPDAVRRIAGGEGPARPWWLDARDPASPCGLGLPLPGAPLPARRAGNEIVLGDGRVRLTVEASGRRLRFDPALADDADLDAVCVPLVRALARRGPTTWTVERIDAGPARSSPRVDALRRHFEVGRDHRALLLSAPARSAETAP
jgi:ATP-dependent Lhr-like helicase